jgi:hypothetical protein
MSRALVVRIEALASELVQRRWAARAALVSDDGEVLVLCTSRSATSERGRGDVGDDEASVPLDAGDFVAQIAVETVDEQTWIYVDLGTMRLIARLVRAAHGAPASAWLASALRRLGVTVEPESLAQE